MIFLLSFIFFVMLLLAMALIFKPLLAKKIKTVIVFLFVFPLISVSLYLCWGSGNKVTQYWALEKQAQQVKAELAKIKNPQQIIDQLKNHLQQYPNSAQGWFLLGRLYMSTAQYSLASPALQKAYHLKSQNNEYATAYAEALFFEHKQMLNAEAHSVLQQVITQDPNNISALNLLGMNAYLQKHYQKAVNYWEPILSQLQPGSQDSQMLLSMIAQAQKHLGAADSIEIPVMVAISEKLRPEVSAGDTVFIYALDGNGSPMPLAVVRKQVSDLPLSLKLGATDSMLPGRSLQLGQKIKLEARISKSGNPMPQAGDLMSQSKIEVVRRKMSVAKLLLNRS